MQLTNIQTYFDLNACIISQTQCQNIIANSNATWIRVVLKQSSIGNDVNIGVDSEINNAIIMDKVEIGDGTIKVL